jgi:hypothetical protein
MPREASLSPGARALRLAGFVKLPALWVTQEEYELILWTAKQHKAEIDRIKAAAYGALNE